MTRARINFVIFAVAVIATGWLGVALDRASGVDLANGVAMSNTEGTLGQLLFIAGPAVVALALYLFSRDGAGPLGFTLRIRRGTRWFAGAALLYPAITMLAVGAGVLVGSVAFSATPAPGKPGLLAAFGSLLVVQLVKNLFEEFIFRGYGTRTAMALGLKGALTPHLLVGVVWALWHFPLYLMWTSTSDMALLTSVDMLVFLPLLVVGVTATAIVYGELRVQTGSLWPGILLHTMCNAIATPLVVNGHLGFEGHSDLLFSPIPSSLVTMVAFGVVGVVLLRRRTGAATRELAPVA